MTGTARVPCKLKGCRLLLMEGLYARSCPDHGLLDGLLRTRLTTSPQGLSRQCGSISWFKPAITCPAPVVLLCIQQIISESWPELAQTCNGSRYTYMWQEQGTQVNLASGSSKKQCSAVA